MTATTPYGEYGGRYVPETLIPALDELDRRWAAGEGRPGFHAELDALRATTQGARRR